MAGGMVIEGDPSVQIIVPSDTPLRSGKIAKSASVEMIEELVDSFGQAAKRAVEAGMDCVELHAAHTYIIHEFLSPAMNRRTDQYGGSAENRAKFPLEVIRAIRKNIPPDMPLFIRVDALDDDLENGLTLDDVIQFCSWAKEADVDVVDVSRGNVLGPALAYEVPPLDIPVGFNVENAGAIRNATGLTTMAVGRINSAFFAEQVLAEGKADLIGMGRVQLTDPEFCNKAREGRVGEIVRCIGCNQGCYDAHLQPKAKHISCVRNPAVGRERELAYVRTKRPLKIGVVGGGMAGMEVADLLSERGHYVTLWEKKREKKKMLGGAFLDAGLAPRKQDMAAAANHKAMCLAKSNVKIYKDTEVTEEVLQKETWDILIEASGAEFIPPPITGIDRAIPVIHVLRDPSFAEGKVVIIGGSRIGLEAADLLSERGHPVTVIEQTANLGEDWGLTRKVLNMKILKERKVDMRPATRCIKIDQKKVIAETGGETIGMSADTVVIAAGISKPYGGWLKDYCGDRGISYFSLGDHERPGDVQAAILDAALLGRRL